MEQMITGYQWSPVDGKYIGEYVFPNNADQEKIHMPPFTTLEKPPEIPEGSCAFWRNDVWVVEVDVSNKNNRPLIEDYSMLPDSFVQEMKGQGMWTAEDDRKMEEAILRRKQQEAEIAAIIESQKAGVQP